MFTHHQIRVKRIFPVTLEKEMVEFLVKNGNQNSSASVIILIKITVNKILINMIRIFWFVSTINFFVIVWLYIYFFFPFNKCLKFI